MMRGWELERDAKDKVGREGIPVSKDALGLLQCSCNPFSSHFHFFKPQNTDM